MSIPLSALQEWLGRVLDVDRAGRAMPKTEATTVHRRSRKWRLMRRKWNREHAAIVRRLRRDPLP